MTCPFSLRKAKADQAVVAKFRENFRNHLLTALSEAREATVGIEPALRDTLMDDLAYYFHPDSDLRDTFTDAFHNAESAARDRVDELSDEYVRDRRRAGYSVAAE
jgi:hypothetical protein